MLNIFRSILTCYVRKLRKPVFVGGHDARSEWLLWNKENWTAATVQAKSKRNELIAKDAKRSRTQEFGSKNGKNLYYSQLCTRRARNYLHRSVVEVGECLLIRFMFIAVAAQCVMQHVSSSSVDKLWKRMLAKLDMSNEHLCITYPVVKRMYRDSSLFA